MDIIHHTLIGGSGYLVAAGCDQHAVGIAFLAGNVLPDLDVFFMVFGKRFYLKNHQAISHSLLLAPIYALLLSLPLYYLLAMGWNWIWFFAALAGLILHVLLDWSNTFGIALFAPLSRRRYSLDAVFFIDGVMLTLTALFYLLYVGCGIIAVAWLYPILFIFYIVGKVLLRQKVGRDIGPLYAIPGSLNPFEFYILNREKNHDNGERGYAGFIYHALNKSRKKRRFYPDPDPKYAKMARQSQVFRDMQSITRGFHITKALKDDQGVEIQAHDLAVRNFGGRFGRTRLRFDNHNRLIDEVADI